MNKSLSNPEGKLAKDARRAAKLAFGRNGCKNNEVEVSFPQFQKGVDLGGGWGVGDF